MTQPGKHQILVDAAQMVTSRTRRGQTLYPTLFFIFNLFLCAAFERHLRSDPTAVTLAYFFVVEFALYGASLLAQYQRLTFPVLERSTVFPFSSYSAVAFCIWSDLRRPLALVFMLTNILLLAVVYHSSILQAVVTVSIYLLLLLSVETVFVAWALFMRRNPNPEMILVLSFAAISSTAFVVAEFFGGGPVISFLPVISWAAHGIAAVRVASFDAGLLVGLLLFATALASAIVAGAPYRRM